VADEGARSIFRYHVYVQGSALVTDGLRVRILQDVPVSWVAVDSNGDVFYSDPGTRAIARIPYSTVMTLAEGTSRAADLFFVSERTLVSQALIQRQEELNGTADMSPTDMPAFSTDVQYLYEGSVNSHVAAPGGIAVDGYNLYWTNMNQGTADGCVVRGQISPELPRGATSNATFPAAALTTAVDQAFGIAKSTNMIVFSSNNTGIGKIYGLFERTGQVHQFSSALAEPRGLVWDGDQTVYVADEVMNGVWSLPVGRLADETPLTKAAVLDGAYGVALLTQNDRAWYIRAGARGLHSGAWLCCTFAALAAWVAAGAAQS